MLTITEYKACKNIKKIVMTTCYDYTSAKLIEKTSVDCVLVGDSAAMVMHGYPNTTHATIDMMAMHTAAVARGLSSKLIVADMPFMTYRKSRENTLDCVPTLIQKGAQAIKLEGADGNLEIISHITESGVPVMGHLGLTPQHIGGLGGFKVQGRNPEAYKKILQDALALEAAGCFSIVLECVPFALAKEITNTLKIPTIGIGAGHHTDGQILVLHDLLGLQNTLKPKFLKHFLQGETLVINSINDYVSQVRDITYPSLEEAYA